MLAPLEMPHEATQRDRLAAALPRWLDLPLYRSCLAQAGLTPVGGAPLRWDRLPFVTKRDMREGFPGNFLTNGLTLEELLARAEVELEHTSGTSEERVAVLLRRGWWDAQETRALRLNGCVARILDGQPQARRAVLTTPTCNGMICHTKWLPRAQRTLGQSLYVNLARIPFSLTEEDLARMAAEIAEWEPVFLDLDPVHGSWFALYCERKGLRFPSLKFVLASYEFVSVVHRRILERVWQVPVFNLYGSTETGHLIMQDERGAMRPCLENALLELVETDAAGVGQLVVTTLTNDLMPLLRYRIGDLAARLGPAASADYVVHGRARDALRRADGTRVSTWQVDQCFAGVEGLTHYQLRQAETGECRLRLLPLGDGPEAADMAKVVAQLETLLEPPGGIVTETVEMLLPTPSGKFRLTCRE